MLDALCFALFSKPFRKINKPTLLNSINQKDAVVELEFDIGKKSYKIIRGLKPTIFEIYCDDKLINQEAEQYTWWSNRGQAWAKNVGWRIDYQIISSGLKDKVKSTSIYKDERFSDHAPLIIDYDL